MNKLQEPHAWQLRSTTTITVQGSHVVIRLRGYDSNVSHNKIKSEFNIWFL